jgi:hypothetical protein
MVELDEAPGWLKNLRGLTQLFVMGGTADSGIVSAGVIGPETSTIVVDVQMTDFQTTEITWVTAF